MIIDLKLDKLSHQDLGQMQMYVNYFDRFVKTQEENPTIGILLCKRKKDAIVELTLPAGARLSECSFPFVQEGELWVYEARDFMPSVDVIFRWEMAPPP